MLLKFMCSFVFVIVLLSSLHGFFLHEEEETDILR